MQAIPSSADGTPRGLVKGQLWLHIPASLLLAALLTPTSSGTAAYLMCYAAFFLAASALACAALKQQNPRLWLQSLLLFWLAPFLQILVTLLTERLTN